MLYVRVTSVFFGFYFYLAHSDTITVTQYLSNVLCYSSSHVKQEILRSWNEIEKQNRKTHFPLSLCLNYTEVSV